MLNTFEMMLNIDMETPAEANSKGPISTIRMFRAQVTKKRIVLNASDCQDCYLFDQHKQFPSAVPEAQSLAQQLQVRKA